VTTANSEKERPVGEYRSRPKKATDEAKDVATAGLDNTSDDEIDAIRQRWGCLYEASIDVNTFVLNARLC